VFICSGGLAVRLDAAAAIPDERPLDPGLGEPLHNLGVLDHLAAMVGGVSPDWPPRRHYITHAGRST